VSTLFSNTIGSFNTANGFAALLSNTTGDDNTAIGFQALDSNTTGSLNTANGVNALFNNITGSNNTANGVDALVSNTTGINNTANGFNALLNNTMGSNNAGIGVNALFSNTTGNLNVALGVNSLLRNTTGSSNIALGVNAGGNLTIGNSNIDIGNAGVAAEANTTRVGTQGTQRRAFIAGISGTAVTGSPVVVNSSGQLGVAVSSERFKEEIKRMDRASEAILALQPVTFRYKKNIDPDGVPQFGLVAEDVEKVDPVLVVHDKEGKPYGVRYNQVNAMLLNEFLKEHCKVEEQSREILEQRTTITELKKGLATVVTELKEQASQIQKVSAQVATASPSHRELRTGKFAARRTRGNGPAPQVVNNP